MNETSFKQEQPSAKRRYWVVGLVIINVGCALVDPDYHCMTRDGPPKRVVTDTPEVRRLLAVEEREDELTYRRLSQTGDDEEGLRLWRYMIDHPEQYAPKHKGFLATMARQPGMTIPEKTRCQILEHSKAWCLTDLNPTITYVKVRFTAGPHRGSEGWMCFGDVAGTVAMP